MQESAKTTVTMDWERVRKEMPEVPRGSFYLSEELISDFEGGAAESSAEIPCDLLKQMESEGCNSDVVCGFSPRKDAEARVIDAFNFSGYVDMGLSVKWAACNVGARFPEGYGDYFAWGETEAKGDYRWDNLKFCNDGQGGSFGKYNQNREGVRDFRVRLLSGDDAAYMNLSGGWRMPTNFEIKELLDYCDWVWTQRNGVYGHKVISRISGNAIFLPAAGFIYYSGRFDAGCCGGYWSASLDMDNSSRASALYFSADAQEVKSYGRFYGQPVRPVCRP